MLAKTARTKEMEALRKLEEWAFRARHEKNDFLRYLEAVMRLFLKWKQAGASKKRANQLGKYFGVTVRTDTHPVRAIIDASSKQDRRVKSRWTRALEYVLASKKEMEKVGFKKFVERNGGASGCASKAP